MKKLSEYKDEEALDLLADILSPTVEIMQDEAVQKFFNKGDENMTVADVVTLVIKSHKKAVMQIMAALEGVPSEEYHCSIFTLPAQLMQVVNDPDLRAFFALQGQTDSASTSGSATGISEDGESGIS